MSWKREQENPLHCYSMKQHIIKSIMYEKEVAVYCVCKTWPSVAPVELLSIQHRTEHYGYIEQVPGVNLCDRVNAKQHSADKKVLHAQQNNPE